MIGVRVLVVMVVLFFCRPVRADEVAPDLEGADLRAHAQVELKRLVAGLDEKDQRRLVGVYVAFDPSVSDPQAQVACDDDGDYVIVLSDAMLRLVAHVARADGYDEANGSRKVEDYAAFLVRSQLVGRRLLPPPPGFFAAPAASYEDRFHDIIAFVIGHELARLRAGDLACAKPTATKERGDDIWSTAERAKAAAIAATTYPSSQAPRDEEALTRSLDAGRTGRGALALLRFFAAAPFQPSYAVLHPQASGRLTNAKRQIETRKAQPL